VNWFIRIVLGCAAVGFLGSAFDTARMASRYALPDEVDDIRRRRRVGFACAIFGGVYLPTRLDDLGLWYVAEVIAVVVVFEVALYVRWLRRSRRFVRMLMEGKWDDDADDS
jgi:hypothetical protein